ncbi:MAG: DnaJ domain-containing protein [Deltaproteobacteria bacterium]|jgi:curved DNA-binding protein CbpA|nr:DnaJ domain-containing protein [Deltaproteobacteria bacterium]
MTSGKEQNFYKALEVSQKVSADDLRAAYLKLALKWHPDRNPGDSIAEERFKLVSQAYAVLRDPQARTRYDRLLAKKAGKLRPRKPSPKPAQGPKPPNPVNGYSSSPGGYGPPPPSKVKPKTPPNDPFAFSQSGSAFTTSHTATYTKKEQKTEPKKEPIKPTKITISPNPPTKNPPPGSGPINPPQKGPKKITPPKPKAPDPEDIILTYFTTPEGQVSLKKIKEELTKTGLGANSPVLDKLNEKTKKTSPFHNITTALSKGIGGIKRFFVGNPFPAKSKVSEYDLTFALALSPEAAKSGTTVDLQYFQDGFDRHLSIRVPPNTKPNTRLRLSGQGNLKPDKSRGDLLLTINIPPKPGAVMP